MRRKTVRALANLGRAAALAGCVLAFATWWLWGEWPREPRPAEAMGSPRPARAAAGAQDAAEVVRQLTAVLERIGPVRGLDRQAAFVADCREQLADAWERLGDGERLERVLDEAVASDANDLVAEARRQELRSLRPDRRAAALERLRQLAQLAPTPEVTAPLVRALVRHGNHQEAFDVLDEAQRRPRANDWRLALRPREGLGEPLQVADTGAGQRLRLAFVAPPQMHAVRVFLPAFASGILTNLRLGPVAQAIAPVVLTGGDGPNALLGLVVEGDGVRAPGRRAAALTLQLPQPVAGPCVLEADFAGGLPQSLAKTTLLPAFAAWALALSAAGTDARTTRFRAWRATALLGLPIAVACDGGEPARVAMVPSGADRVAATWRLDAAATELCFELPPDRVCLPLQQLEITAAGTAHTFDLTTHPDVVVHAVERSPAGFTVTGERPQLRFRPGLGGPLQSVTLRGAP